MVVKDGRLKGFWFGQAPEAGGVGVFVKLGRRGYQVAFGPTHLVDSPCNELS